jgi:hypothetical protein
MPCRNMESASPAALSLPCVSLGPIGPIRKGSSSPRSMVHLNPLPHAAALSAKPVMKLRKPALALRREI